MYLQRNCCQVFLLMLLAKKMNFLNDSSCATSRDNEHKGNINLPLATCSTGMFSSPQKLLYFFNLPLGVLFTEEDRTSENFMSILEKQVC